MNLMIGSEEVVKFRQVMEPLEGMEPLRKFVHAYANVSPDGGHLTNHSVVLEAVIFAVWLEACAAIGVQVSDPTSAAIVLEGEADG